MLPRGWDLDGRCVDERQRARREGREEEGVGVFVRSF